MKKKLSDLLKEHYPCNRKLSEITDEEIKELNKIANDYWDAISLTMPNPNFTALQFAYLIEKGFDLFN